MLSLKSHDVVLSLLLATAAAMFSACKTSSPENLPENSLSGKLSESPARDESAEMVAGRYFGFVKISPQKKVTAILDLAELPAVGSGTPGFRGVMRFFAGDFMSDEYSALYLPQVTWESTSRSLAASGYDDRYKWDSVTVQDGMLDGVFTFVKAGITGNLRMRRQQSPDEGTLEALTIFPESIHARRFTGNYYGHCDGKQMTIQIEAARWSGAFGLAGVLDGLRVAGRFGLFDKDLCGSSDQSCIYAHFRSGDLNFLTGAVNLRGNPVDKSCVQDGDDLVCDGCRLSTDSNLQAGDLNPPQDFQVFRRRPDVSSHSLGARAVATAAEAEGQYFGYLHHETQDRYQLIGLNVMKSENANQENELNAVASLYFGGANSPEFVAHRFEKGQFLPGQRMLLDGPGGGFLIVEEWREGSVKGTWYSKSAGRIGTVEVRKGEAPELPAGTQTMPALSGLYEGDQWQFEISVSANVSETSRDYYPLRLMGWAREKVPTSRRRMIEDGSYDFYSNSLAFRLDDGRMAVGRISPKGFELFWPPYSNVGTPMERQSVKTYMAPRNQPATVSSSRAPELDVLPPEARSQSF